MLLLSSNPCNNIPRVAQWYGTMAMHTLCRVSVLIVFVVFLPERVQFCWFDKAGATADI